MEDITNWFLDTFERAEELENLCRFRLENISSGAVNLPPLFKECEAYDTELETKIKSDPAFDLTYSENKALYPHHDRYTEKDFLREENNKLIKELALHFSIRNNFKGIRMSGNFIYKKRGRMGWHTNSDDNTTKIYITYTLVGGKSSFDYLDRDRNIISTPDRKGFTVRQFFTGNTPETIFWHRVRSQTLRLSMGFTETGDNLEKQDSLDHPTAWPNPFYT